MQDNFENIEDQEGAFLNDSWAKMSAMLEEDMPVGGGLAQKEGVGYRRYVVLLLLLVISGAGAWWLTANESELTSKSAPFENTSSIENLETSTKDSEPYNNVIKESYIIPATTSPENIESEFIKKGKSPIAKSSQSSENSEAMKIEILNSISPQISHAIPSQNKNLTKREKPFIKAVKPAIELTPKESSESLHVSKVKIVERLAAATIAHPVLEEGPYHTAKLTKCVVSSKKWSYGISAGIQQEKLTEGFGGIALGFVLNRKLANNFTLETGLNYSLTQFNNTMFNNSPTSFDIEPSNPGINYGVEEVFTATYNLNDANPAPAIQLGSASWLSLPVLLTYQPTRKWRVNMGVEYSQLLQAKEQKIINNSNDKKGTITELIAENNISALTGLTWFPQKNLGIDVRYQFGFTDLSKSNSKFIDQTDTRAALQWSLIYYFDTK